MEEKGLFFVIVLALLILGIVVLFGLRSYREIQEPGARKAAKESSETASPKIEGATRTSDATVPKPSAPGGAAATATAPNPFDMGREYYKQGKYADALDSFKKAMGAAPENTMLKDFAAGAQAMLDVQAAMLAKKWDEALTACSEAEKHTVSARDAMRRRGEIQDMKSYDVNYERGTQAAAKKDYGTALKCLHEAARIAARLGMHSDADQLIAHAGA